MGSPNPLPAFADDEEFDFDGDARTENGTAGVKRDFGDLEDDEEDLYPTKKIYGSSIGPGSDHATTTILNLRASAGGCEGAGSLSLLFLMNVIVRDFCECLEERDSTIAALQKSLKMANMELEKWNHTFTNDSLLPSGTNPDPAVVFQAMQHLQASESQLIEQLLTAKRRESIILVKLANTEQEIVDLKSVVHDLKIMAKPAMQQARRLLLDPAIHAEFTRMKKELEGAEKRVKELQDDLAAVQFTPHSKHGKLLMAKCRTLQEENSEIGREASEGKLHELGTRLAMQKSLNMELRRGYQDLYETVEDVNEELERSVQTVFVLQRKLLDREHQLVELRKQLEEQESRKQDHTKLDTDRDGQLEDKDNHKP